MANSIGRRGGNGTLPLIGWPGGKSSLAVSLDADGCGAAAIGSLGAGSLAAFPLVDPMGGGAVAFGLGHTILLGAAAGGAGVLAATCIGLADGVGCVAAAEAEPAAAVGGPDAAGTGCATAILDGTAGTGGSGAAGTGATGDATAIAFCGGADGAMIEAGCSWSVGFLMSSSGVRASEAVAAAASASRLVGAAGCGCPTRVAAAGAA